MKQGVCCLLGFASSVMKVMNAAGEQHMQIRYRGNALLFFFFFILPVEVFAFTWSVTIEGQKGKEHHGGNTLYRGSQSLCWAYYLSWFPPGRRTSNPDETHNTTRCPLCVKQIALISLVIPLQLRTQTQQLTHLNMSSVEAINLFFLSIETCRFTVQRNKTTWRRDDSPRRRVQCCLHPLPWNIHDSKSWSAVRSPAVLTCTLYTPV